MCICSVHCTVQKFCVPKGESDKHGSHITPVRKILRANKAAVIEELQQKEQRLVNKLPNKYNEDYNDVSRNIKDMYTFGMNESSVQAMIRLLFAICGACEVR